MLFLLAVILSSIPSIIVILWLIKRKSDESYVKSCYAALYRGFLSILPILVVSGLFAILNRILKSTLFMDNIIADRAFHKFIVLAFSEELVKFWMFLSLLKKKMATYTWADIVVLMILVGAGFGIAENIPYAVGASPMIAIVRGVTMGHVGYAFIMGWFYGKKLYTGKNKYAVIAFLIPFLFHGLYDFSLSPELLEINDIFAFIAVSLAIVDIILVIILIRFFTKAKKKEIYNNPLINIEA